MAETRSIEIFDMNILDINKVQGKRIKLSNYTHVLAYHACRAEDEQIFRTQGLKPYTKDEALSAAVHKLESTRVSRKDIEAKFEELWGKQAKSVYLMLETTELLRASCHYLIYGSEFINALAMQLGCRDRLKEIGKPMFVVCAVPISDIHKDWLDGLEQAIKRKDTANRSIAVSRVAAENVVDVIYPTGVVRDPYSWRNYKLR